MRSEASVRRAVDVLARQLELCRAAPGRGSIVLCDDASDPSMVDTAVHALEQIGAPPTVVSADDPPLEGANAGPQMPEIAVNLLDHDADAQQALIPPSARVLSVVARTTADLRGVVPHAGLGRRVKRGLDLLETGQKLHVGSENGTNLRIDLKGARRWSHDGLATVSGQAAEWPRGMIGSAPAPGTARRQLGGGGGVTISVRPGAGGAVFR